MPPTLPAVWLTRRRLHMVALSPAWSATRAVSLRREHLRQGRVVIAHFAHKPGSIWAGESVLHLAAKMRLAHALTNRERPFVICWVCQRFGCEATHDASWEPLTFDQAAEEVALGAYRLNVAAIQRGSVSEVYCRFPPSMRVTITCSMVSGECTDLHVSGSCAAQTGSLFSCSHCRGDGVQRYALQSVKSPKRVTPCRCATPRLIVSWVTLIQG